MTGFKNQILSPSRGRYAKPAKVRLIERRVTLNP